MIRRTPQLPPHWQFLGRVFSAGGTGLVLALVGISITISGATDAAAALSLLAAAWVVAVAVVLFSEYVWQLQIEHRIAIAVASAGVLGVAMVGIAWFEIAHRPHSPPAVATSPSIPSHDEKRGPPPAKGINDAKREPEQTRERKVVNVSPEYLTGLYKDGYAATLNPAAIYIGRWIKLSGVLGTISAPASYGTLVTFTDNQRPLILMHFDAQWVDRLADMVPGQTQIDVLCQIEGVSSMDLRLHHCELLESGK
jgi:hypothetical protein